MGLFLREKIFIFSPTSLYEEVMSDLVLNFPILGSSKEIAHDFISWGIRQAFKNITGFEVENHKDDMTCRSFYEKYRFSFENFVFIISSEMKTALQQEHTKYNLVLTYERLYIITY